MENFRVVQHVIPGQHIREHPYSVRGPQEAKMMLSIKQYIPLNRPEPVPDNAITVIAVPGNTAAKELFEPIWERLCVRMKQLGVPLRAVWIADLCNQESTVAINEPILGEITHWNDHSRDLLHMINHFRDEMPRPLVGVAHSLGCAQLVHLSTIHPRLLSALVLYEPMILDNAPIHAAGPTKFGGNVHPGAFALKRPDLFNSLEEGQEHIRKRFAHYHPEVVARHVNVTLRPTPTRLYNKESTPGLPDGAVTLATSKYDQAMMYAIPNVIPESAGLDKLLLPDWHPERAIPLSIGRPEPHAAMEMLPFVRANVLWAFGSKSFASRPEAQDQKMKLTGSGFGGSGGVKAGKVEKVVLEGGSHNFVCEDVDWTANVAAEYFARWWPRYLAEEKALEEYRHLMCDPVTGKPTEASLRCLLENGPRPKL
ncbi:hypothetical protein N7493_004761 [Penicillium malachiteum]|uniref:AB hydrolase-1 domain-containing protein n=1 Tax=Penicillium malachiteum TaxID=1324776 RepID=A0AAD6HQ51_9EURO|nr:hypothetical protein N7493_004761 [Penicillium malachiteum]